MSLKTMMLRVYHMVNTQQSIDWESIFILNRFNDLQRILSKLFIVSILGTRLHTEEVLFLWTTMAEKPPVILTIAGFDPSSGAGVTADIKTIAAHGCYGVACITAMTVQSTAGVLRVEAVDPALVTDTLKELASDIPIAAVHIGMLGTARVVKAVAEFLGQRPGKLGLRVSHRTTAQCGAGSDPQVILRGRSAGRRRNSTADREAYSRLPT